MDDADKAQIRLEWEEDMRKRARQQDGRESSLFCEDCGETIPEKRRLVLRGAHTCLACAVRRELRNVEEF